MNTKKFFILVGLLGLIPYLITLQYKPFMLDNEILDSIASYSTIDTYINSFKTGENLDIQPLRDLSHIIDIKLSSPITKDIIPLIHNLILFSLIAFILYLNFIQLKIRKDISTFLVGVFILHPSIFHIFIEFTARKHILSFLFAQLSIYFFLKGEFKSKKNYFTVLFLFLCSIMSHPINVTFIIAFLILRPVNNWKKRIFEMLPFGLLFIGFFSLTKYYYSISGTMAKGNIDIVEMNFYKFILASAIYLRQFILPYSFSTYYDLTSISLLLFLLLSPFLYFTLLKANKKKFYISAALSIALYLTLYSQKTNIYSDLYSNNYLLAFSFAFLFALSAFLEKIPQDKLKLLYTLFPIYLAISCFYASLRIDKYEYYQHTTKLEPHCKTTQYVLMRHIERGKFRDLVSLSQDWVDRGCLIVYEGVTYQYGFIYTHLILFNDKLSLKDKMDLFNLKYEEGKDIQLLKAFYYLHNSSDPHNVSRELLSFKDIDSNSIFLTQSYLGIELVRFCKENKKLKGCSIFNEYLERVKNKPPTATLKLKKT